MRLTDAQKRIAVDLAVQGKTNREIREALNVPHVSFYEAKLKDIPFAAELARARAEGLEELADSLLKITDTEQDVQKARLLSDNYKFILAKRKPEVYGDRIDLNVNQTVDIGGALAEARARLPLSQQTQQIKDVQPIELVSTESNSESGSKPVDDTVPPISIDDLIE